MDILDLSVPVGNTHRVWLREISETTFEEQRLYGLGDDYGLFIAVEDTTDGSMAVLAKAPDEEIGRNLLQLVAAGLATSLRGSASQDAIFCLPASV